MIIRVWYTGRDFFGGVAFDQEAEKDPSTEAEAVKLAEKCLKSCGGYGPGSCSAFRLELANGCMIVVDMAGPGVFRVTHARNGDADAGNLYGLRECKALLAGIIKREII